MAKKKKNSAPVMHMKQDDIKVRRRLLDRWGHMCLVCGREFANIACVTKEHIVPKSVKHSDLDKVENIAPSHYRCNQLRKADSLLTAARHVDQIERMMSPKKFVLWLNQPVPNRLVPEEALKPLRSLRSFELPLSLPGMP